MNPSPDDHPHVPRARRLGRGTVVAWFALAFGVRLVFSLVSELWGEDQLQIFLIGLKFFTTGQWPYYGPDVVYTQTRIPGALQGLLVGGPFWIVQQPEAPYVALSLLSFLALSALGWYIAQRSPRVPAWFLWTWIFFSPWTLDFSTHFLNPSYTLIGAVAFTLGSLELVPASRVGAISRAAAGFWMGFGLLWVYQLHLSASLFVPLAGAAFLLSLRAEPRATAIAAGTFVLGALLAGSTLVPTLLHDGWRAAAENTGANIVFEPSNLIRLPQIAGQFLSFATFEVPRFIGANTHDRLSFLLRFLWAAPFILVATILGLVQVVVLAVTLIAGRAESRQERAVRITTLSVLALLYVSFLFSVRAPASHAFYVTMPLVVIYAFQVWQRLFAVRALRVAAMVLFAAGAVTHVAIATKNFKDTSLYTRRDLVVRALAEKNYRLVGERRADSWKTP